MQPLPSDDITDLLVAYALGALEPEAHAQISTLLREQPELQQHLAELRATVAALPLGLADAAPPPALRQRVLDRAVGRTSVSRSTHADPVGAIAGRLRGLLAGLAGLSAALVIALLVAFGQIGGLRTELASAQIQLATAQTEQHYVAQVLAQPLQFAELTGAGGRATVLKTPQGEVVLAAALPPLAADRVYQLWLIEGSGAPVSAGIFRVDADGRGMLTLNADRPLNGATLAITDEPAPGSPSPTSDVLIAGQLS